MVTPQERRNAVVYIVNAHKVSERRACSVIKVWRGNMRYISKRGHDDKLRQDLTRLASERHRFGYKRLTILLKRE